jgi:hypothetical protein
MCFLADLQTDEYDGLPWFIILALVGPLALDNTSRYTRVELSAANTMCISLTK